MVRACNAREEKPVLGHREETRAGRKAGRRAGDKD
jgi:hypothetical protein